VSATAPALGLGTFEDMPASAARFHTIRFHAMMNGAWHAGDALTIRRDQDERPA
jgi:hypothetical protein